VAERDVTVRAARPDERVAVRRVLDAAVLAVDDDLLDQELDGEGVLVAVSDERVIGALVADTTGARSDTANGNDDTATAPDGENATHGKRWGAHVDAVAVQRRRRAQGIGTALLTAATERWRPLTADFDADVRPFYETLGFEIVAIGAGRFRGRLH